MTSDALAAFGGRPAVRNTISHDWPLAYDEDVAAVTDACAGKRWSYYSSEREITAIEAKMCSRLGRRYALALNSGTSALHVAFLTLGLTEGDEVLVPSYTFPATVMPLVHCLARIVFYDTAPCSPVPGVTQIEKRITQRTKAIVVAHMDGYSAPMADIMRLARDRRLLVIEDVAQALGAATQGSEAGCLGDLAAFSFTEKKIAVSGEGGMLVMNDRGIYEKAVLFSYLQKRSLSDVQDPLLQQFAYTGLGFNLRMHPFAAALAGSQLERVDGHLAARAAVLGRLREALGECPEVSFPSPPTMPDSLGGYSIKLLLDSSFVRDTYVRLLAAEGVPVVCSETIPLHRCALFEAGGDDARRCVGVEVRVDAGLADGLRSAEHYAERTIRMPPLALLDSSTLDDIKAAFLKVGSYLSQRSAPT